MLATLIPLFNEKMEVSAYSLFAQKENHLLRPSLLGTGGNDGAADILGLDIITAVGVNALTAGRDVFVTINQFSLFAGIEEQCTSPRGNVVLLCDPTVAPQETFIKRIIDLKEKGFRFAMRKLGIEDFHEYHEILSQMDYILLNHKKINIQNARAFFGKVYPKMKLVAVNVNSQDEYDTLKKSGSFDLYEGEFFRMPVTEGAKEVAPLKANYIQLLKVVNDVDFDLTKAADVVGQDTALVISLLKMANTMSVNSEITSVRHAAAMLGQKELKKWINTAVTKELCADKPSEITRLSLIRGKFAENLAPSFNMAMQSQELFLMGMFSVLDIILDKPMTEALEMVKISTPIKEALCEDAGILAPVKDFILAYENANWQEVSRQMILGNMDMDEIYKAYVDALIWFRDVFS